MMKQDQPLRAFTSTPRFTSTKNFWFPEAHDVFVVFFDIETI